MKKFITVSALVAGTFVLVGSASAVHAQEPAHPAKSHTFIQKLAEKLGLSQEQVKSAVEDLRKHKKERLEQAVKDGVITEAQKSAILEKWTETKRNRKEKKAEMKAWFKEQGIDFKALREYMKNR